MPKGGPCTKSPAPRALAPSENFENVKTLLGGISSSRMRGYVGQWETWEPQQLMSSPPSAAELPPPQPLEVTINFRLFQLQDPASGRIRQCNLYQQPGPAAAGYKPFITSDVAPGRPDGYSIREWSYTSDSALFSTDAAALRAAPGPDSMPGVRAEATTRLLAVPDYGICCINAALPSFSSLEQQQQPQQQQQPSSWFMEAIFKEPSSDERRWALLTSYDERGQLSRSKSINEDLYDMPAEELDSCFMDPSAIHFSRRRDMLLGSADRWPWQQLVALEGTATRFAYDEQHQLTVQTFTCYRQPAAAAAAAGHAGSSSSSRNDVAAVRGQSEPAGEGGVVLVQQTFTDWLYSVQPADLQQSVAAAAAQGDNVMFELGVVTRDGSLVRWLIEYESCGQRLLAAATLERYLPVGSLSVA